MFIRVIRAGMPAILSMDIDNLAPLATSSVDINCLACQPSRLWSQLFYWEIDPLGCQPARLWIDSPAADVWVESPSLRPVMEINCLGAIEHAHRILGSPTLGITSIVRQSVRFQLESLAYHSGRLASLNINGLHMAPEIWLHEYSLAPTWAEKKATLDCWIQAW